jgi:hypothetical protein
MKELIFLALVFTVWQGINFLIPEAAYVPAKRRVR